MGGTATTMDRKAVMLTLWGDRARLSIAPSAGKGSISVDPRCGSDLRTRFWRQWALRQYSRPPSLTELAADHEAEEQDERRVVGG